MGKIDTSLDCFRSARKEIIGVESRKKRLSRGLHQLMETTREAVGLQLKEEKLLQEVPWLISYGSVVPASRNARGKLIHGRVWKILKTAGMIEQVIPIHVGPNPHDKVFFYGDKDFIHITLFRNGYKTCGAETPEQRLRLARLLSRLGLTMTTTKYEVEGAHDAHKEARSWYTTLRKLKINE